MPSTCKVLREIETTETHRLVSPDVTPVAPKPALTNVASPSAVCR